ncbi:MAG TPA: DUF4349 domain-containing protein [Rhodocyclaceae bacterium]|nr:DUF4349 domain-containing protein [Rhodocyclaceae bacterium]
MKPVSRSLALAAAVLLSACSGRQEASARASAAEAAPASAAAVAARGAGDGASSEKIANAPAQRFIALSHQLTVETESTTLQQIFEDAIRRCEAAGCEVLNSGLSRGDAYNVPSAVLSARIPPQAVDGFLGGLEKEGTARVIQHQRQAEDKTGEVVDAEARIANLTELRDRLRKMLASRPGSLSEVLEVERELAETQSKLDSMRGLRKALANQTEKVAMNIQFQARRSMSEQSFFAPAAFAWHKAGRVLMGSLGSLITFIAAALPWLLVGVPVVWGLRGLWRRRKTR